MTIAGLCFGYVIVECCKLLAPGKQYISRVPLALSPMGAVAFAIIFNFMAGYSV